MKETRNGQTPGYDSKNNGLPTYTKTSVLDSRGEIVAVRIEIGEVPQPQPNVETNVGYFCQIGYYHPRRAGTS